jgi:hypothetical protein
MKNIQTFESFLNESYTVSKLEKKFSEETGISVWDFVKRDGGKWTVASLWEPKNRGGVAPGLSIELTKGSSRVHFQVMDDDGNLTQAGKDLKKA